MFGFTRDADWYRVKYSIAATHANRAASLKRNIGVAAGGERATILNQIEQDGHAARRGAFEVAYVASSTIEELSRPETLQRARFVVERTSRRANRLAESDAISEAEGESLARRRLLASPREDTPFIRFLSTAMEPAALVLLAGTIALPHDDGSLPAAAKTPLEHPDFAPSPPHHVSVLDTLTRTLRAEVSPERLAELPARQPSPPPVPDGEVRALGDHDAALFVQYVGGLVDRAPRVEYNFACLWASWGQIDKARTHLLAAVEATPVPRRPRLIDRATKDATLVLLFEPADQPANQDFKGRLETLRDDAAVVPTN
jgi:hypothetical protein